MSYGMMGYRCDFDFVKALLGANDPVYTESFLKSRHARFTSLDGLGRDDRPAVETARIMLTEQDRSQLDGTTCWYIFEEMIRCAMNSKALDNRNLYPCRYPEFLIDFPEAEHAFSFSRELGFAMVDDYPIVYRITSNKLGGLSAKLQHRADLFESEEQHQQFLNWLDQTMAYSQDLVFFYY
ncbi:DUF7691 family protein [Endozoicomonadaceae bacterium StTr2]